MDGGGWFLLGAPWDCSGTRRGEMLAPGVLRAAGLGRLVDVDLGDADTVIVDSSRDRATGVRGLSDTVAAARALAAALDNGMRGHPGRRPLVVGGDCSLLLGVFAHLRGVGLWMIDGHPDYADAKTSDTGETADMELAVLTGNGPPELAACEDGAAQHGAAQHGAAQHGAARLAAGRVEARHVALIGHRTAGLDAASAAELGRVPEEMVAIGADEVIADPHGAGVKAAAWAEGLGVPMWLHIDVDVLDAGVLPAVTYPQGGGPDFEQLAAVLAPIAGSPRLIGVSVADFRPDLDPGGRQAARLVDLLAGVLRGTAECGTIAGA